MMFGIQRAHRIKKNQESTEQLLGRIDGLKAAFPKARKILNASKDLMAAAFKQAEGISQERATKEVEDLINDIQAIEEELKELSAILKMNEQIKKYLFKPIKRSQDFGLLVTFLFGFVGLFLTVPEIVDYFEARRNPFTEPEYFVSFRLENVRNSFDYGLIHEAKAASEDILSDPIDQKTSAQASIYLALSNLLDGQMEYDEILTSITDIPNVDNFIIGQKSLLTGVFHLKNGQYDEASDLLRRVSSDERFINFHLESNYYRFLAEIDALNLNEMDSTNLQTARVIISRMEESENANNFIDMTTGKSLDQISAVRLARDRYGEILKVYEEEARIKRLQENINSLRIAIRYNRYNLGSRIMSNPAVKRRADELKQAIEYAYPDISINYGPISSAEVQIGGYGSDKFYVNNEIARSFFVEDLIIKLKKTRLREHALNRTLEVRYNDFDLVVIFAEE